MVHIRGSTHVIILGKFEAETKFQEETLPLTTDSARLEASEIISFKITLK